jgi:ADP-heptose:LPS heptosyltransferase
MKHFLIIQTAFLGDVILCTPVVSELKRIYPDALIDIVVRKGNESLLQNNPKLNEVFVWNKKQGKYKTLLSIIKQIRKNKYDEVINLQRFTSAGLMCLRSRANYKIGFNKNAFPFIYNKKLPHNIGDGRHEVERNLSLIAHHGANNLIRPELFPSKEDYSFVQHWKENNYFCLAPASVWETKKLPFKKWVELIDILKEKGDVYLLGGPDDLELCEKIKKRVNGGITILSGQLSLLQSAALMRDANMNFVNDSGPLHLASAMNAPTRAFFCSTIGDFGFGPLSDDSKVVEIDYDLHCRPCGLHGYHSCPKGHFKCGNEIDIKASIIT